ncbi:uncharacterized protein PpBr36_09726, partial [Pyricularia pennisetigena]|uniref:uncharacterized protein n=1 Tax=Pyricularia pennisetigena TaxID=1578925 RepID=UPI001153EF79
FANVFAVVTSVTHVVQVRQAPATSECKSIMSSFQSALPKMPSDLASAESIVETDVCHYIRPPIQTTLIRGLSSKLEQWETEVSEWLRTSSNAAMADSVTSRCSAYLQSSALSSMNALMSCASEFQPTGSTKAVPATTESSSAAGKTTAAETGSSVTPAGAATPTPSTPGAGARSGVSIDLAVGAVLVGSFLVF